MHQLASKRFASQSNKFRTLDFDQQYVTGGVVIHSKSYHVSPLAKPCCWNLVLHQTKYPPLDLVLLDHQALLSTTKNQEVLSQPSLSSTVIVIDQHQQLDNHLHPWLLKCLSSPQRMRCRINDEFTINEPSLSKSSTIIGYYMMVN